MSSLASKDPPIPLSALLPLGARGDAFRALLRRSWTDPRILAALIRKLVELGQVDPAAVERAERSEAAALALETEVRGLVARALGGPAAKVELLPRGLYVVWGFREFLGTRETEGGARVAFAVTRSAEVVPGVFRQEPLLTPALLRAVKVEALGAGEPAKKKMTKKKGRTT